MRLVSAGHALPSNYTSNEVLEAKWGLEAGWIERRTGILRRPTVAVGEATSDLATAAGEVALAGAGLAREDIHLLLLATSTPDHPLPPSSPLVAHRLGLTRAGAVDLAGACSGFLYALTLASAYCDSANTACLVIGANTLTPRVDPNDATTASLFADGAGAVVVIPSKPSSLLGHALSSDGSLYSTITIDAGGAREPITAEAISQGRHLMKLHKGPNVFRTGVQMMAKAAEDALVSAGMQVHEIDWFLPHQANARMIQETARKLGIPAEKTISVVDRIGNSSAATTPVALSIALNEGRVKRGQTLLMTVVGAGMISAAIVLRW